MDVLPLHRLDRRPATTFFTGFDAIRAFAALGVVMLHACVPYLQSPMPGLTWPVRDTPNGIVDVGFWATEVFIMPLFLVLAGFLAWQTLQHRGGPSLVKNRAKRLCAPFVFGCLIVLPLDLYVWVLGWVVEGIVEPVKLKSFRFDSVVDRDLWGTSHLWFLLYLFLYVAGLAAAHAMSQRLSFSSRLRLHTIPIALILIGIAAITLFYRPNVVWGFQHAFEPVPSKWIYSGLFFAAGTLIAARDPHLGWLQSNVNRMIAPAVMLLIAAVALGRWHLSGGDNQLANASLSVITVLAGALATLVIIGMSVKHIRVASTTVSYIAAASFWIYLVHHPILGLVHIDLKLVLPNMHPIVKVFVSFTLSTGLALMTYECLVRKTRLGRWLGFARTIPKDSHDAIERAGMTVKMPLAGTEIRRAA